MSNENQFPQDKGIQSIKSKEVLDGQRFKLILEAGVKWLKANSQIVNSLNVFPVPDGDTGTNMLLTMQAAYNEIASSDEKNVGKMASAVAQGALMGARGNSGVILSQLWRGFARTMDNLETMDAAVFAKAMAEARDTAYKGVVRPVEGTILTVAKDVAMEAEKTATETDDLRELLERVVQEADASVKRTPDLLPILKQAGVVDSGGKGLFYILEGMLKLIRKEPLEVAEDQVMPIASLEDLDTHFEIEEGQDYEVIVDFQPDQELDLPSFYDKLSDIGTSIQVGEGDDLYRMHIHVPTENRYQPIDYIMQLGTISKVFIENLMIQQNSNHREEKIEINEIEPGQIAVVAVSPGKGLSKIFASLGVAAIIEGGQTMNPSTEEILSSFENLPTDQVIILPNNKNILLAAQAAQSMTVKNMKVIPSVSVPQGLSAMLRLEPDSDFDQVVEEMQEAITELDTGEITTASRDVEINGVNVKQGSVISLLNGKLIDASSSLEEACTSLIDRVDQEERERITLFYGQNMSNDEVAKISDLIEEKYPSFEVEVHEGGQPHYQFIISIE